MIDYGEVLDPVWGKLEIYGTVAEFHRSAALFSKPLLLLYAAHLCQSEVHNGGFLQFFWNSSGVLTPEAIEGFAALGLPRLSAVADAASRSLGYPYPRNRDERWDMLCVASGRTKDNLEAIFAKNEHLYISFAEVTEPLGFGVLDQHFWDLAREENGGFEAAANRYASSILNASHQRIETETT